MILSGQLAALLFARFSWINDPYIHTNREKCKKNGLLMLDLCHQKQHEDIYLTFYNNYYFLSTITDSFIHSSSVTASQSLFWEHWEYILDGSPVHCSTPLIHTQKEVYHLLACVWEVGGNQRTKWKLTKIEETYIAHITLDPRTLRHQHYLLDHCGACQQSVESKIVVILSLSWHQHSLLLQLIYQQLIGQKKNVNQFTIL